MSALDTDIQYLPGVGPKRAALLKNELGTGTFGDLIRIYPFRYIDRSSITRICDIRPDLAYVQVMARITKVTLYGPNSSVHDLSQPVKWPAVKRMSVMVADTSGEMEMVFFKGMKWNYEKLRPGNVFVFFGKPSTFGDRINLVHPEVDPAPQNGQAGPVTGTLTGVYNSTEKLKNAGITGKIMNKMMSAALGQCLQYVEETLPDYILRDKGLVPLRYALRNIHFPESQDALAKATYRLKFEELFFLQLSLLKQK